MKCHAASRDSPIEREHEEDLGGDAFMKQPFGIAKAELLSVWRLISIDSNAVAVTSEMAAWSDGFSSRIRGFRIVTSISRLWDPVGYRM
jgi:hypothetical protein